MCLIFCDFRNSWNVPTLEAGAQTYKPENALKRAEELIAQDQPVRALNALHDVISNRKYELFEGIFSFLPT